MRTKLGKDGEVAIAPEFMEKLGIVAGDVLLADAVDGDARLRTVESETAGPKANCSASRGAAMVGVSATGTVILPAAVRDELGMNPGDALLSIEQDGTILIYTPARLRQFTDGIMAKYPHLNGRLLSEELIRERREEAKREEEEYG